MIKTKPKTSEKRQNKGHHIDVRFTKEEYNQIVANANKCGMHKSNYVHDAVLGHQPKQLMTEGQEEALKSLSAARSELVGIRNALHGLPQEVRKRYFRNERIMTAWIEGINYLIQHWDVMWYFPAAVITATVLLYTLWGTYRAIIPNLIVMTVLCLLFGCGIGSCFADKEAVRAYREQRRQKKLGEDKPYSSIIDDK